MAIAEIFRAYVDVHTGENVFMVFIGSKYDIILSLVFEAYIM